ncbi:MAG: hypothetical protein LBJ67_10600 [Planctomycetaceae bacterium]|jgi:hypothetical protein|nr:hypothetical protein [Planctomycetaceae bacterium]
MRFLQTFYLTHFSKPASYRSIYRHIQQEHPRKVLEIGIQNGERTIAMLKLLLQFCGEKSDVHYSCVDPFESRAQEDGPGLSLRKAHRMINKLEIPSRLIPLSPLNAVRQLYLNRMIEKVDLVIIATPNIDWLEPCLTSFRELIHESAGIFFGVPTQKPEERYSFEKIDFNVLEYIASNHGELPQHNLRAA